MLLHQKEVVIMKSTIEDLLTQSNIEPSQTAKDLSIQLKSEFSSQTEI